MNKRLTFDEDVINYDKWRPRYCDEVFRDILNFSNIDKGKQIIEIGCGTGQATEPFLKTGCLVTAVEYGKNMAEFVAEKYRSYSNFIIHNIEFENYSHENESVDLVFSATAFHWIPEKTGYNKVFNLLKSRGTLALFWNKPFVSKVDDLLHQEIQGIYKKFRFNSQGTEEKPQIEDDQERYRSISETITKYGFIELECKLYKQVRFFNADDYVALLNTYSDHRSMEALKKNQFENEIKSAINNFSGILKVYDTIDLYLARKP